MRRSVVTLCSLATVMLLLCTTIGAPQAYAKPKANAEQRSGITAQEAARKAKSQYGGKVLKVSRAGNGYKVKLLLQSGRVMTVTIRN